MLSPENPYVLPSTLVAAGAYLAATLLTDASLLVRIGLLVLIVGVVPAILNRLFGGAPPETASEEQSEEPPDA